MMFGSGCGEPSNKMEKLPDMEETNGINTTISVYFVPEAVCETAKTHLTTYRQWNASFADRPKIRQATDLFHAIFGKQIVCRFGCASSLYR